jgi:hypothetical protein
MISTKSPVTLAMHHMDVKFILLRVLRVSLRKYVSARQSRRAEIGLQHNFDVPVPGEKLVRPVADDAVAKSQIKSKRVAGTAQVMNLLALAV